MGVGVPLSNPLGGKKHHPLEGAGIDIVSAFWFLASNIKSSEFSWLGPRGCRLKIRVTCQFQVGSIPSWIWQMPYIGGRGWRVVWEFPLRARQVRGLECGSKNHTKAGLTIIQPAIGASRIWVIFHIRANWIKSMVMSREWWYFTWKLVKGVCVCVFSWAKWWKDHIREIALNLDLDWQSFQDRGWAL